MTEKRTYLGGGWWRVERDASCADDLVGGGVGWKDAGWVWNHCMRLGVVRYLGWALWFWLFGAVEMGGMRLGYSIRAALQVAPYFAHLPIGRLDKALDD